MSHDGPGEDSPHGGRLGIVDRLLPPVEMLGEDGHPRPSRMTRREQLVAAGLGVGNVAISGGIAGVVHHNQGLVLLAGLAASVVTLVGARVGNRILALVGLFASTLVSGQIFFAFALPYYAGAIWIFLKYNRLTKAQGVLRRQQRAEQQGGRTAGTRSGRAQGKGGSGGKGATGKGPAKLGPPRSKRYTPPKPVKKRPPPPPKPPRDRSILD